AYYREHGGPGRGPFAEPPFHVLKQLGDLDGLSRRPQHYFLAPGWSNPFVRPPILPPRAEPRTPPPFTLHLAPPLPCTPPRPPPPPPFVRLFRRPPLVRHPRRHAAPLLRRRLRTVLRPVSAPPWQARRVTRLDRSRRPAEGRPCRPRVHPRRRTAIDHRLPR